MINVHFPFYPLLGRYAVQDGLLVRVKQQQQRTFPLIKVASTDPAMVQDDWQQQQQQQGLQAGDPSVRPWGKGNQSTPQPAPPSAAGAAAAAAGAEGAWGTAHQSAGVFGDPLPASNPVVREQPHEQMWDETDFAEAEEGEVDDGAGTFNDGGDGGDNVSWDIEVLAELLADMEEEGVDRNGAQRAIRGRGPAEQQQQSRSVQQQPWQREEQKQQQQEEEEEEAAVPSAAVGGWFDWRTAEPSQMQQYGEMLQNEDGAAAAAMSGAGGRLGAAGISSATPQPHWVRPPSSTAAAGGEGAPTYGLTLSVFVYCVPAKQLKRLLFELQLPLSCISLVSRVCDADVVLHCLPQHGQRHFQYDAVSRGGGGDDKGGGVGVGHGEGGWNGRLGGGNAGYERGEMKGGRREGGNSGLGNAGMRGGWERNLSGRRELGG